MGPTATQERARTRDITGSGGTDRANHPPKRPKVVISRHDHGSRGAGAWQTKSEAGPSAATARPHPARTRDITGLRGTDRANRPPKRPKVVISRHDHGSGGAGGCDAKSETAPGSSVSMIAGSSRSLRPKDPRDHGSTGGGGCNAKSEIPGPADQAPRLVIEWTADLSQATLNPPRQQ